MSGAADARQESVEAADARFGGGGRIGILRDSKLQVGVSVDKSDATTALQKSIADECRKGDSSPTSTDAFAMVDASLPLLFKFPRCKIAALARAYVQLVDEALAEACAATANPHCAGRLVETVRCMLEMFAHTARHAHFHQICNVPAVAGEWSGWHGKMIICSRLLQLMLLPGPSCGAARHALQHPTQRRAQDRGARRDADVHGLRAHSAPIG